MFTVLYRNSFAGSTTRLLSRYIQRPDWDSNPLTSLLHGADILEKITGSQLDKKFPAFYGTRSFIAAFTIARHLSLPSARWFKPTASSNQGSRVTTLVSPILNMDTLFLWPTQIVQREPNIFIFSNNINVTLNAIGSYRNVVNVIIWKSPDLISVGEIGFTKRSGLTETRLVLVPRLDQIATGF